MRPASIERQQRAIRTELARAQPAGRVTRQQHAVGAGQRVEISRRLLNHAVEIVEIARPHRDRDDAAERAVGGGEPTRYVEQLRAFGLQRRDAHLADVSAGVALPRRGKIAAAGEIGAGLERLRVAGRQRPAVAIDHHDRLHLRHDADDALQPRREAWLRGAHLVIRHAAHHFLDFREHAVDGFEDLQRLLLQHVERTRDALVGHRIAVAIVVVGGVGEQRRGERQRRDHHKLQQPDRRVPLRAHRKPMVAAHATRPGNDAYARIGNLSHSWGANEAIRRRTWLQFCDRSVTEAPAAALDGTKMP